MSFVLVILGILAAAAPGPGWELVGQSGALKMVYVEAARAKDTKFFALIVDDLIKRNGADRPMQIDFFDDREQTPVMRPYTATQKAHHRAKFNFNPANGMRRFVWVSYAPADPNEPSKLKISETEESLPSP